MDWLSFNGDFNYNYFHREGTYESTDFDFNADQWSSRLTTKIEFPADFTLEMVGNYQSKRQTFQSLMSGYAMADIGVRKKVLKGKVILNLSVRDAFASRILKVKPSKTHFPNTVIVCVEGL